ncbi:acyl-phosphate glycerol 3-phosphate acyltransferase [Lactobacillus iners SPIN 1401G]|nr:acyl-phosphate glycerol 3-phosphate acyltransferase [Lactobacillus iners SPIN 2503V10-D]EGG32779.1 acyl-phosphate glycerol 3-phosphate acyltransferase [Lactobacillus iners SPIN 1401G]PMC29624.1 glycerol-3-phosphate acyltransferase [Lactobacillus iners]
MDNFINFDKIVLCLIEVDDNIMSVFNSNIILFILAYLLGSFPSGLIVGLIFFKKDIRNFGSGNIGTTNTFRILGPKAGIAVLFADVFKGWLAVNMFKLCHIHVVNLVLLITGLLAILGHTFSIFLKFKGGKAVATIAGVLFAYNFNFTLVCATIFLPMIFITSCISLSALISIVIIFIVSFLFHDIYLSILLGFLVLLVYIRHRSNIIRLINGKENIIPFGLFYWYRKIK